MRVLGSLLFVMACGLGGCAGDADSDTGVASSALLAAPPGGPTYVPAHWVCQGTDYLCVGDGECSYNGPGLGNSGGNNTGNDHWFSVPAGTVLGSNEGVGNWLPYCGSPP